MSYRRLPCRRLASVLPYLLLLAASPVAAAEEEYAIGQVRAGAGSNPVLGVEDGIVYSRQFTSDCRATPPEVRPLAASLTVPVTLEVTVIGCRESQAPRVSCSWRAPKQNLHDASCRQFGGDSASSRPVTWTGWRGEVAVDPPAETGVYELILDCEIAGSRAAPIAIPLYVTYAEPQAWISPPEASWYGRACCWGAGLSAETSEAEVLRAIQGGLYRFGAESWQYGYSHQLESRRYRFPLTSSDHGESGIEYRLGAGIAVSCGENSAGQEVCKCPWSAMVENPPVCSFGDCYVYSSVLQAIAGVMGVGGLRPVREYGANRLGFLTRPVRSFDSGFGGNLVCDGEVEVCFPYYFANHSLRLRDGCYYDATFDQVYDVRDALIALNTQDQHDRILRFEGSKRRIFFLERGYGTWGFYFDPAQELLAPAGSPPLRFTGDVDFSAIDDDGDGLFEALVAEVGVEIRIAGQYLVHGFLDLGTGADGREARLIPSLGWNMERRELPQVAGEPGIHKVALRFSGEAIFRAGLDGPWQLELRVSEVDEPPVVTPTLRAASFGELAGYLSAGRQPSQGEPVELRLEPVDPDRGIGYDGPFPATSMVVRIAPELSLLALEARLAIGGTTVAYGGARFPGLAQGPHPIELRVAEAAARGGAAVERSSIPARAAAPEEKCAAEGGDQIELTIVLFDRRLEAIAALHFEL